MKLLAEEKEVVDKPDAEELTDARGELELDHVSLMIPLRLRITLEMLTEGCVAICMIRLTSRMMDE
jgi:hypothetical protein